MRDEPTKNPAVSDAILLGALRSGWRRAQVVFREMFPRPVSLLELSAGPEDTGGQPYSPQESIIVGMRFHGSVSGLAALILERAAAGRLVESLFGEARPDHSEVLSLLVDTSLELGNVVLNAIVAEAGRALAETYHFDVPTLLSADELEAPEGARVFLLRGEIAFEASHAAAARVIVHRGPGIPGGR